MGKEGRNRMNKFCEYNSNIMYRNHLEFASNICDNEDKFMA
jgi:hypothetical protein